MMNNLENNDFHPHNRPDNADGAPPWVWGGALSFLTLVFLAGMLLL